MSKNSRIIIVSAAAALTGLAATSALAAAPKPTVVLVHGAFATAASWDKVAGILRAKGITVATVDNPLTSLADDVAATRAVLAKQTGPVVLVGHSWGGVVIGEAGDDPKVKSLVYVAAFGLDKGESIQAISAGSPPPAGIHALRPDAKGNLLVDPAQFPTVFAGDVPVDEAKVMAAGQLAASPAIFAATSTVAAWHVKPSYYVVSSNDQMIPPQAEAFFAQRMKATTITLPASHAVMVSEPDKIADLIIQAVDAK
ncbi:alpha/beta fold hydrolase [Asticcacaulis solisilvae]|uniref:alpha/beta fold hydrolase n=1 Tax=Asticcacaulis solisilvae TaxID=1217274 RepID=UPI003FD6C8B2